MAALRVRHRRHHPQLPDDGRSSRRLVCSSRCCTSVKSSTPRATRRTRWRALWVFGCLIVADRGHRNSSYPAGQGAPGQLLVRQRSRGHLRPGQGVGPVQWVPDAQRLFAIFTGALSMFIRSSPCTCSCARQGAVPAWARPTQEQVRNCSANTGRRDLFRGTSRCATTRA